MPDPKRPAEPGTAYRQAIVARVAAVREYKQKHALKTYPFDVDLDEQAPGTGHIIDPDRPDSWFVALFQGYSVYARDRFQAQQALARGIAS